MRGRPQRSKLFFLKMTPAQQGDIKKETATIKGLGELVRQLKWGDGSLVLPAGEKKHG